MINIFGISPYIYAQVYYWTAFIICAIVFFRYSSSPNNRMLLQQNTFTAALALSFIAILFLGLRPIHYVFGDMVLYANGYRYAQISGMAIEAKGEWVFAMMQQVCINLGLSANFFFFIVTLGYIGFQYWACRKLLWENSYIAMLFILSAFEFYVFAVNGLRNGLACAMVMLAMAIAIQSQKKFMPLLTAAIIAYLSTGIHRSCMIPIACAVAAQFIVKNPKHALLIWVASIGVSLVSGNFFVSLMGGFVEDNRSRAYVSGSAFNESTFSHTGFRWDFLVYSLMPVILIWFATQKRKINDVVFNYIGNTYLLANSFWILVIRANFSNRFAYLSWFLYPLVLAYGLIRLKIWDDQDRRIGLYLLAHAGFTLVMFLLGKL